MPAPRGRARAWLMGGAALLCAAALYVATHHTLAPPLAGEGAGAVRVAPASPASRRGDGPDRPAAPPTAAGASEASGAAGGGVGPQPARSPASDGRAVYALRVDSQGVGGGWSGRVGARYLVERERVVAELAPVEGGRLPPSWPARLEARPAVSVVRRSELQVFRTQGYRPTRATALGWQLTALPLLDGRRLADAGDPEVDDVPPEASAAGEAAGDRSRYTLADVRIFAPLTRDAPVWHGGRIAVHHRVRDVGGRLLVERSAQRAWALATETPTQVDQLRFLFRSAAVLEPSGPDRWRVVAHAWRVLERREPFAGGGSQELRGQRVTLRDPRVELGPRLLAALRLDDLRPLGPEPRRLELPDRAAITPRPALLRPYLDDPSKLLAALMSGATPAARLRRGLLLYELRAWLEQQPELIAPLLRYTDRISDPDEQSQWVVFLGRLPVDAARRFLRALARDERRAPALRAIAVRSLAQRGEMDWPTANAPRRLIPAWGDGDPDDATRDLVLTLLQPVQPGEVRFVALRFAESLLYDERSPALHARTRELVELLEQEIASDQPDRQLAAALAALSIYEGPVPLELAPETLERVRAVASDEGASAEARVDALAIVARQGGGASAELLVSMVGSQDAVVRMKAMEQLSRPGVATAEVRMRLIERCAGKQPGMAGQRLDDQLMGLALGIRDPQRRRAALVELIARTASEPVQAAARRHVEAIDRRAERRGRQR